MTTSRGERQAERVCVVPGQTLTLPDRRRLKLCAWGFHGSVRALDALGYAPGPVVQYARLHGRVLVQADKACANHRTCVAVADASLVLFEFACWCAERVLQREREAGREPYPRSWAVISARRAWLRGEITNQELAAADAARAARAAASDAAWAAEVAPWAAEVAPWAAAWAAADAARAAESEAQNAELEARLRALLGLAAAPKEADA